MRKNTKIKLVKKSALAYIAVLVCFVVLKKYWSGGGIGRMESHYSISWEQVWLNLPYYAIAALIISFFY